MSNKKWKMGWVFVSFSEYFNFNGKSTYCWPFQCPFLTYLVLATYLKNDPHHTALQAVSCLFLAFWDQIFDTRCSKLLSHSKVGLSLSAVSCLGVSHNYRNVANISKSLISDSIVTNKSVHKRNQFGFWVGCCQVKPSPFIGLIKWYPFCYFESTYFWL